MLMLKNIMCNFINIGTKKWLFTHLKEGNLNKLKYSQYILFNPKGSEKHLKKSIVIYWVCFDTG